MRIDSGNIGMDSARLYRSSRTLKQSVETGVSDNFMTGSQFTSTFSQFLYKEDYTEKERSALDKLAEKEPEPDAIIDDPIINMLEKFSSENKTKISPIKAVERDTASEFKRMQKKFIMDILELLFKAREKKNGSSDGTESDFSTSTMPSPDTQYVTVSTTTTCTEIYERSECTSFSAKGTVLTDDGRSIEINIDVSMSSRFVSCFSESITTVSSQIIDPLVINLSDAPASLSDQHFYFDLDADGTEEYLSKLGGNSAFLALDKNGDGKINDGSELFGTKSGDGFKDLSLYDEDHNGWIDENDSIFNALKIWAKDENGNDILYSLKDKDIGAICLSNVNTQFSLNSQDNQSVNGYIRKTGIFLYENGTAGTLQHVDMVM